METAEIVIIGAGIIGCHIFRRLSLNGLKCLLLEKNPEVMNGASSGNSGIFHCGFDANPSFTEFQMIRDSWVEIEPLINPYFPLKKTGAFLVAWNDEELAKLKDIINDAHKLGFKEIKWISLEEFQKKEPNLNISLVKGVLAIPNEWGIDSWRFGILSLFQGLKNNGKLIRNCLLQSGQFDEKSEIWRLSVKINEEIKEIKASIIINCAGNFGDIVEENLTRVKPDFKIRPRKGEYVVFNNKIGNEKFVNSFIFPVPNEKTKGVLMVPTIYGILAIGPTAEDQDEREFPKNDMNVVKNLIERGAEIIPTLEKYKKNFIGYYAGLRPSVVDKKDYIIKAEKNIRKITIAGIRSTGVSGSLGTSKKVLEICNSFMNESYNKNQEAQGEWEAICKNIDQQMLNLRKKFKENLLNDENQISVSFMGEDFKVTHPLVRLGINYGEDGLINSAKPKF